MTDYDLAALDAAEKRFGELTVELRTKARNGIEDASLAVEWTGANYAFHDVIYAAAGVPYLERVSKAARRTFIGQITWVARSEATSLVPVALSRRATSDIGFSRWLGCAEGAV